MTYRLARHECAVARWAIGASISMPRRHLPLLIATGAATAALGLSSDRRHRGACGCSTDGSKSVHVWFVRHAETENNVLRLAKSKATFERLRSPDAKLTEKGLEQVFGLDQHPALKPILKQGVSVSLYCSPLQRAIETAAPLQQALPGKPVIRVRPDLSETGGLRKKGPSGEVELLPGLNAVEIQVNFPDLHLDCGEISDSQGWAAGKPCEAGSQGSHNIRERAARVSRWLRETCHDASNVVIIAHGNFVVALLGEILGVPYGKVFFAHGNCAVSHIELRGDKAIVHFLNALPNEVSEDDSLAR